MKRIEKIDVTAEDKKRFIENISFGFGSDACWTWMGCMSSQDGRGRFWVDGNTRSAPTVSYTIYKGETGDLYVCHKCDNPSCVNPNHLFLGTSSDNMKDMISKGRRPIVRGGDCKISRLSNEDAMEIIRLRKSGVRRKDIAKSYGVTPENITNITSGITFKNLVRK